MIIMTGFSIVASRWEEVYTRWPELGHIFSHVATPSPFRMQDSRLWEGIYPMQQLREDISEINGATALPRVVRPENRSVDLSAAIPPE